MLIKTLRLKNFRNYAEEEFSFDAAVNVLAGANAQGKTNAAEAVFLLCTGYSPRATKEYQLVKKGAEKAEISCRAESRYGEIVIEMEISRTDKKNVKINGTPILRIGELLGNVNSVFFNPNELKLVKESPEDRRRFMNISLSQMSKSYLYALNRYNKILQQRNNLLKEKDRAVIWDTLPIWDAEFSRYAAKIILLRNEFLKTLGPLSEEAHAFLSGGKETLKISSESGYYGTEEEIAFAVKEDLRTAYEKDVRLGFTTVGPHRDDMKLFLDGEDVRVYGSQGQQRTVALALKLAETEIFRGRSGEYPVLVLDDVLSELDKVRQRRLIERAEGMQTIITCTNADKRVFGAAPFKKMTVLAGKLKKISSSV
ncbi:MAG: DNA replication/repair protein RecF [Bacillota bacterium]|nr:MAG: DNA replication/repair protein RecF [Bacillota bacterium]